MNSDSQNERMTMVIMAKKNLRHTILHFNVHIMRELFPFSDCSNSCKMLQDNHVFIRGGFLVSMLRYLCRESHITVSSIYKRLDRKSTRLNSSHRCISYAVFCLKKKTK